MCPRPLTQIASVRRPFLRTFHAPKQSTTRGIPGNAKELGQQSNGEGQKQDSPDRCEGWWLGDLVETSERVTAVGSVHFLWIFSFLLDRTQEEGLQCEVHTCEDHARTLDS